MLNCVPTIAIIDSGLGGVAILNKIIAKFKCGNFIYFADNKFMPYGNKHKSTIQKRINCILEILKSKYNVAMVIIACNTASTCLDGTDNFVYTLKFNKNTIYFATKLTQKNLLGYNVIADKNLAKVIENNILNKAKLEKSVSNRIKKYNLEKHKELTLACTHYELIEDMFKKLCPATKIKANSDQLIKNLCLPLSNEINVFVALSQEDETYRDKIFKLINWQ